MPFEHPKIVIVGAGAMGSLFGGAARRRRASTSPWSTSGGSTSDAVNRNGLVIVGHGGERTIRLAATLDPQAIPAADVVPVPVQGLRQ